MVSLVGSGSALQGMRTFTDQQSAERNDEILASSTCSRLRSYLRSTLDAPCVRGGRAMGSGPFASGPGPGRLASEARRRPGPPPGARPPLALRYLATVPVPFDVFDTVTCPDFDPATLTVMDFPACAEVSLSVDFTAPLIAVPFAYH